MRRSLVLSSSIYTIHGPLATLRKGGAQIPHSQPISAERLSLDARHAELHDRVLTVVCRRSLTSEPACFIQGRECFVDVNESAHSMRVLYKQNESSLQQTDEHAFQKRADEKPPLHSFISSASLTLAWPLISTLSASLLPIQAQFLRSGAKKLALQCRKEVL